MRRLAKILMLAAVCAAVVSLYAAEDKRARRQRERLENLSEKLSRRMATPDPQAVQGFLHAQAGLLLERARQSTHEAYVLDRLCRAVEELLEASEEVFDSRKPEGKHDRDERRETAEELQRHYFRVQQADYFARLSGLKEAPTYVVHARSLYQQARSAYDAGLYKKAQHLGDAADGLVDALENLAQAAVRTPDPPVLK